MIQEPLRGSNALCRTVYRKVMMSGNRKGRTRGREGLAVVARQVERRGAGSESPAPGSELQTMAAGRQSIRPSTRVCRPCRMTWNVTLSPSR